MNNRAQRISKTTFLAVVAIALIAASDGKSQSVADVAEQARNSVVLVETIDSNGRMSGTGTGFFVAQNKIITNNHVVENASGVRIRVVGTSVRYDAKVLSLDRSGDLALLQTETLPLEVRPLRLSRFAPRVGDKIIVLGSPFGLQGTVSDGIVSAFRDSGENGMIVQITAPISPGSSGSPVMNLSGHVVGVATSYINKGQNLNFAISAERVIKLWPAVVTIADTSYAELPEPSKEDVCGDTAYPYDTSLANPWEYIYKGQNLLAAKRFSEAKEAFKRAVTKNPKMPEAYFSLWRGYTALWKLHKTEDCKNKASIAIRQALILDPKNVDFRSALGLDLMANNHYIEALEIFIEGTRIRPKEPTHYENLGLCYAEMRRYDDALKAYAKAVSLDARSAFGYAGLGSIYVTLRDQSNALKQLKILEKLDAQKAFNLEIEINAAFSKQQP